MNSLIITISIPMALIGFIGVIDANSKWLKVLSFGLSFFAGMLTMLYLKKEEYEWLDSLIGDDDFGMA